MCRALAYLGRSLPIDDLLFASDSSLVRQSYAPQQLHMLNLGGFGAAAWHPVSLNPQEPYLYHSTTLPIFDGNLRSLAQKVEATCLLAHVRGIAYQADSGFGPQNLHPFRYPGYRLALAHNGDLAGFHQMRIDLLRHVAPHIASRIRGTTDSEHVYALLLSQLAPPSGPTDPEELLRALRRTLEILAEVRERHGIRESSALNLFLADGTLLLALRFTFDFGCYATADAARLHEASTRFLGLWWTVGERYGLIDGEWQMASTPGAADSVIFSSEPLTRDVSGWVEVPEYSAILAQAARRRRASGSRSCPSMSDP